MTNYKTKNLKFILNIFLFFIIIPFFLFFFLKDYSYLLVQCNGISIIDLNYKTLFSFLSVLIGVLSIVHQINKEKNINEAKFVLDLNNSFSRNTQISDFFYRLELDLDNFTSIDSFLNDKKNKTTVIEYIVFFETINILLSRKILKISEVNDLFAGRFFIFVNNKKIQDFTILKNNKFIKNIYQLYNRLIEYRTKNNLPIPYEKYSLNKIDKEFYKFAYIKNNNFNYVYLFILFVLLFLLFILNKNVNIISFYCKNTSIEISFLVGVISAIVGIVSVLIQTIKDKRITEGKFIMDLNNNFLMNDKIDEMLVKLEYEEDGKCIKDIKKDDVAGVMEYIIFFETVYNSIKEKAITIEEVDKLFAKRFFMFVNNKAIQKNKIIKDSNYLQNIYKLYDLWIKYRTKNELDIPYNNNSLEKNDKNYYKLISKK